MLKKVYKLVILILIFTLKNYHPVFSQNKKPLVSPSVNVDSFITARVASFVGKPYLFGKLVADHLNISVDSLRSKVIFLHSWIASCSPCIAEFEGLNQMYSKIKNDPDFLFVSFTYENDETIRLFRDKYKLKYPVIKVTQEDCRKMNLLGGFPANILLDRKLFVDKFYYRWDNSKSSATEFIKDTVTTDVYQLLGKSNYFDRRL